MYVIFSDGGKQYRAVEGKSVLLEKRPYVEGKSLVFQGLGFGDKSGAGKPCTIEAMPTGAERGEKIIVFKKKRRHNYRRKNGHRQEYLRVTISKVTQGGKSGS